MSQAPFQQSAAVLDLTPRVFSTASVVGSPAAATETIVASLTINQPIQVVRGVLLAASVALTVGASGSGVNLKIRRTDASGQTVMATGILNVTAADLVCPVLTCFDTFQAAPGQVYVATITVANGAATSTVSAVSLAAIAI